MTTITNLTLASVKRAAKAAMKNGRLGIQSPRKGDRTWTYSSNGKGFVDPVGAALSKGELKMLKAKRSNMDYFSDLVRDGILKAKAADVKKIENILFWYDQTILLAHAKRPNRAKARRSLQSFIRAIH